jgi:integrase
VHDLRHTAARLRREAGADVEEIREFLAHSSLAVTQVYLHRLERKSDHRAEDVCLNLFKLMVG